MTNRQSRSHMQKTRATIAILVLFFSLTQSFAAAPKPDWSRAVVESTMKRYPTAESLKGWGYAKSLYLYGVYLVYLRTRDPRYLEHIKAWIDLHIDDQGT